ncbi:MAG TPA: hypothetical protein VGP07_13575 [Polyangia bacterium]
MNATTKMDPVEEMLARGSIAHAHVRAAKRHGSLIIGQTTVGTVTLERVTASAFVLYGAPTISATGEVSDAPVLARGKATEVAGALAKLYVLVDA